MDTIINKVQQSGLLTIDLEEMYDDAPRKVLDIKEQLFMGLMLKEKEFRDYIKVNDWEEYRGCLVSIVCSSDAIVPTWAYMLIANKLSGVAKHFIFGTMEQLDNHLYMTRIDALNMSDYQDQRVVVKGCSDKPVPTNAYVYLTARLTPVVKSIMYGEPCSTVPVYKKQ